MTEKELLENHEVRILELERTPMDLLRLLKGERVKVKFPRRYVAMWVTSVIIGIFRDTALTLVQRIKLIIGGEELMSIDWLSVIRPDYMLIALGLGAIGFVLKELTDIGNNYIPLILLVVSFVSCSMLGYISSEYIGFGLWVDSIMICGVMHGAIAWAISTGSWDLVHGIKKKKGAE